MATLKGTWNAIGTGTTGYAESRQALRAISWLATPRV